MQGALDPRPPAVVQPLEQRTLLSAASGISFDLVQRELAPTFSAALGDLNHDGFADLVSVNPTHGTIHILLNRGDGTFSLVPGFLLDNARWATIADFNGDGNSDIAVVSPGGNKHSIVEILYGNGDGTFPTRVRYSTHVDALTVASADFNGDGLPDLAFSNRKRVSVMFNTANQTFSAPVFYEAGGENARSVTVGDFNGDGAPDLAVVRTNDKVDVLLNQKVNGVATGVFGSPTTARVGIRPQVAVTGDFNGDGKLDLATVNSDFRVAPITVLLGNGDGTFQPARNSFGGNFVDALTVGDFNGDGKLDLATSSFTSAMRIYPGNGDGTFAPPTQIPQGQEGIFMTAADLNNDGKPDVLISSGGGFRVLLNTSGSTPPSGTPGTLAVNFGAGSSKSVRFLNSHGFMTTVSLSGPGSGTIHFTGSDLSQQGSLVSGANISIDSIAAAGTSGASNLSVSVGNKSGVADVNSITIDGQLNTLSAPAVLLHGNCTVQTARSISFDSVTDGTLSIGSGMIFSGPAPVPAAPPLTLKVTRADGMSVQSQEKIQLLQVGQWTSSDGTNATLFAPGIATLRCAGPFAANLSITGGGIGAITAGQITVGAWNVVGSIGKISAGELVNLSIDVHGAIGTISVSRHPHLATFGNVHIIAESSIGSANLGTISFNNSGTPFGLHAKSIGRLSGQDVVTGKSFSIRSPASSADVNNALIARGIAPADFLVQIG